MAKQLGRALEGRIHPEASDDLNEIFAQFRENDSIRMAQFDWLVICYGNELCLNYSPHYQEGYIRSKLRAAAKVLQLSKEISSEITDLSSVFHVKNCNAVIEAIRKMGKFDHHSKLFGSPGTASTTVTLINTIGEMMIVESMKLDDQEKERNAERFLKVFKKDVRTKINKRVAVTIAKNRRGKKLNIPTTADIMKLSQFLDTERDASFRELNKKYSYQTWLKLLQLTLVSIMIFNRKRAGEMGNLLVTDFHSRELVADQPDMILKTIPEEMRNEIKSGMEIRGKKERDVPVLLKHSWEECIHLLIRYRTQVGIPESNDFLFALPTQTRKVKTLNVWTVINSYANKCGAENPSSLKGTNLRKHLASYCATKNLKDRDITNMAAYMGHDPRIHLKIYRQNPLASRVAHIAPILMGAQGNNGKTERAMYASDTDADFDSDLNVDSDSSQDDTEELKKPRTTNTNGRNMKKVIVTKRKTGTSFKVNKASCGSVKKTAVRQTIKRSSSASSEIKKANGIRQTTKRKNSASSAPKMSKRSKASA